MMQRGDLRDASVLARTELAAMWRRLTDSRRQLIAIGLGALQFVVVIPVLLLEQTTTLGSDLVSGSPPVGPVGAFCTAAVLAGAYMGVFSAISQNRIGSVGPLIRTSVPPSAVSTGRLASETLQASLLFVVPLLVILVLVGVGAGGPLAPSLLGLALLVFLLAGLFLGRTVGATARYAGVLARLSAWAKAAAFMLVMVLVFAASQFVIQAFLPDDADIGFAVSIPAFLPGEPIQGAVAVFLAPFGTTPGPVGILGFATAVLAVPVFLALAVRAETALLVTDVDDDTTGEAATRSTPWPFTATPASRIGFRHLLRTARDPKSAFHLLPVVFGGLGPLAIWVGQPDLALTMGPPLLVILGAEVAGLLYCLNPLGDDRDQLPFLMTSVRSTDVLLRGRLLGGAAVGVVIAVGLGTPLAVIGGSPLYVALQTALAVVLVVAIPAMALGIGSFAPKFEREEYMNIERAQPSQRATMGFLFGGTIVAGAGMFLAWWTVNGDSGPLLLLGGWVGYLAVITALAVVGYRYAVGRFDGFTLDDV
jgi:ABC-2 type transport system permease protein